MSTCDTLKQQIAQLTNEIKSLLTSVKNEFKNKCKPPPKLVPLKLVTIGLIDLEFTLFAVFEFFKIPGGTK